MNIYEYIKEDHKKVSHLFQQFNKTKNRARKLEIVSNIAKELAIHLESEQATFYKVLEGYAEAKEVAMHGSEEHSEIENQINTLLDMKNLTADWEKKVAELQELVDHHVKEEEGIIHKQSQKVLSDEQALAVKEQMHNYKQKINIIMEKSAAVNNKDRGDV